MRRLLFALGILSASAVVPVGTASAQTFCAGTFGSNYVSYRCRNDILEDIHYRAKVVCNGHTTVWGPTRVADDWSYGPASKATCPSGLTRTGSGYTWW